ncbi:M4 family metallopeptidase [Streptomyces naganishii]|uniref:M4 family metallopeptidase n=1 Tax=Streptomyces naganishii TaxID=285447 RepID=UPI0036BAF2C3
MRNRISALASTAALVTMAAALAAPAAAAQPEPPAQHAATGHAGSGHTAGPSAFRAAPFTTDPSPSVRKRVVEQGQRAIAAHTGAAHVVKGDAFTQRSVVVDRDGSADVRYDRTYQGLPVYGGDVVVHLKADGSYKGLTTASWVPQNSAALSVTPRVSPARAASVSRGQLRGTVTSVSTPHRAVWMKGRSATLVWETVVVGRRADGTPSRLHVLVDARKGQVVETRDEISAFLSPEQAARAAKVRARAKARSKAGADVSPLTAGNGNSIYSGQVSIDLTQSGGTWSMTDPSHGNGYTTDLNHATSGTGTVFSNSTGTFGDGTNNDPASAGVDAHYGAAETFDYYKNVQGRNGIFGDGKGVPSRTHYGNAYVNAFWDGTQMTYGDGQNDARPLVEIDVAGHEMSHGVSGALTGWDETGETGGMNEGTSDIFGTMVEFYANNPVDTPDYTMGELININGDGKPLRYMYQPSLDGQSPDCYDSNNGNLDPHYSMGPLNHWFFLAAVGSGDHGYGNSPTCNNSTVTGIGNDKAGKIWYKALASYANSHEDYAQARIDSLKAAADLYGTHCTEYNTIDAAWAAVSVTGSDPVPGTCPGQGGQPAVTSPGNQTGTVGTAASVQIHATDPNNKTLTYSATGLPAGLSINSSTGLISGTPTTAGTSTVTVTATNTDNASGSATFTWTVNPAGGGGCTSTGEKVANGGFENGTSPWSTSSGVISTSSAGESPHSGTYYAYLDGYGSTHTDTASQSVTVPAGCKGRLTLWLHVDTAETTSSTVYDKLSVKLGNTTLATYSNLDAGSGYTQKSFDVSAFAGQTVTLTFTGTEDSSAQTSFTVDDVSLNAS